MPFKTTTETIRIMKEITLEELINLIYLVCETEPIFKASIIDNPTDTMVCYNRGGKLAYVWLHGVIEGKTINNIQNHRVAYELDKLGKGYDLNHYKWIDGKGWTFIGSIITSLTSKYSVKDIF